MCNSIDMQQWARSTGSKCSTASYQPEEFQHLFADEPDPCCLETDVTAATSDCDIDHSGPDKPGEIHDHDKEQELEQAHDRAMDELLKCEAALAAAARVEKLAATEVAEWALHLQKLQDSDHG